MTERQIVGAEGLEIGLCGVVFPDVRAADEADLLLEHIDFVPDKSAGAGAVGQLGVKTHHGTEHGNGITLCCSRGTAVGRIKHQFPHELGAFGNHIALSHRRIGTPVSVFRRGLRLGVHAFVTPVVGNLSGRCSHTARHGPAAAVGPLGATVIVGRALVPVRLDQRGDILGINRSSGLTRRSTAVALHAVHIVLVHLHPLEQQRGHIVLVPVARIGHTEHERQRIVARDDDKALSGTAREDIDGLIGAAGTGLTLQRGIGALHVGQGRLQGFSRGNFLGQRHKRRQKDEAKESKCSFHDITTLLIYISGTKIQLFVH